MIPELDVLRLNVVLGSVAALHFVLFVMIRRVIVAASIVALICRRVLAAFGPPLRGRLLFGVEAAHCRARGRRGAFCVSLLLTFCDHEAEDLVCRGSNLAFQ